MGPTPQKYGPTTTQSGTKRAKSGIKYPKSGTKACKKHLKWDQYFAKVGLSGIIYTLLRAK